MLQRHTPRQVFTNPVYFLAYGFGTGLSPWAPGTAGTLDRKSTRLNSSHH